MVKPIAITAALSLALGSIGGYWLQKLESQPIATKPNNNDEAIAAASPINPKRIELKAKYALCTNAKKTPEDLDLLDDKALNDLVYKVCLANS